MVVLLLGCSEVAPKLCRPVTRIRSEVLQPVSRIASHELPHQGQVTHSLVM